MRRRLSPELNLDLYHNLNPALFDALFAKPYQLLFRQLFASLYGSWFEGLSFGFCLLTFDFFYGPL